MRTSATTATYQREDAADPPVRCCSARVTGGTVESVGRASGRGAPQQRAQGVIGCAALQQRAQRRPSLDGDQSPPSRVSAVQPNALATTRTPKKIPRKSRPDMAWIS